MPSQDISKSLKGFYDLIQSQGGLRYGYQFMIFLKFPSNIPWNAEIKELYSSLNKNLQGVLQSDRIFPLYVKSTTVPDLELTTGDVAFLAAGFKFPGIVKYKNTWDVTVQLDQKLQVYEALLAWKETMSSYALNNGGQKTIPNIDAEIDLLDQYSETPVKKFAVRGIFPTNIQEISMEYKEGSNTAKTCNVTFAMQWYEEVPVNGSSWGNLFGEVLKVGIKAIFGG